MSPATPLRGTLHRHFDKAEVGVIVDLAMLIFNESGIDGRNLGDLIVGDMVALAAPALAHLLEKAGGVDELHLARPPGRLAIGDNPDIRGDAGIVKQVGGQRHNRFQPVMLDNPLAKILLSPDPASPVKSGEPLNTMADAFRRYGAFLFSIHFLENQPYAQRAQLSLSAQISLKLSSR